MPSTSTRGPEAVLNGTPNSMNGPAGVSRTSERTPGMRDDRCCGGARPVRSMIVPRASKIAA